MEILIFLLGAAVAFAVSWIILNRNFARQQKSSQEQLLQAQNDLNFSAREAENLNNSINELKDELRAERQKSEELGGQLASMRTAYANLKEKLDEQKQEVEKLNEKFSAEFKNLANEIFEEKSKKFTTQNKENLGELLSPLREKISEFQKKIEDSHTAGEKRSAALGEQLKHLKELNQEITKEAKSLTLALRGDSKSQGSWGEMQLESILEKAGLQKDLHYFKEKNYKTEEGANQRLDFIINLPDGKHLVLDSKVSLSAYSRYFDCENEVDKERCLKEHLASINNHIKMLGEKNYHSLYGITTPDYVMMFIANEPALTTALREDPQLYEKALARNIVLVSTTTLLATLRTISYIWKQDLQNKNAEEIARQAGALYDKFVGFTEDLTKLGNQLGTVQNTYRDSMKKLTEGTGNLVRRTENLRELGAKTSKDQNAKLLDRAN